jgi:hypothetical protein
VRLFHRAGNITQQEIGEFFVAWFKKTSITKNEEN